MNLVLCHHNFCKDDLENGINYSEMHSQLKKFNSTALGTRPIHTLQTTRFLLCLFKNQFLALEQDRLTKYF